MFRPTPTSGQAGAYEGEVDRTQLWENDGKVGDTMKLAAKSLVRRG